jgi:hypothetical protein
LSKELCGDEIKKIGGGILSYSIAVLEAID